MLSGFNSFVRQCVRPEFSLPFDFAYQMVDYGSQLFHRKRIGQSRDAIEYFQNTDITELVHIGPEPSDQDDDIIAGLIASSRLWDPEEPDLRADRRGLSQFGLLDTTIFSGAFRMFPYGDSVVTRLLKLLIANAPTANGAQAYLRLQQLEEEVHTLFLGRYSREVFRIQGDQRQLEELFRKRTLPSFISSFDELEKILGRLEHCSTPESLLQSLVNAIAAYHLIAEGFLAKHGALVLRHILKRYPGLLPGFKDGFGRVQGDEVHHVTAGVEILRQLVREHPELARGLLDTVARMAPSVMGTDLPWLPKFSKLVRDLLRALENIGITPAARAKIKDLYAA